MFLLLARIWLSIILLTVSQYFPEDIASFPSALAYRAGAVDLFPPRLEVIATWKILRNV